jgi:peptide/nickel transport system permease protein
LLAGEQRFRIRTDPETQNQAVMTTLIEAPPSDADGLLPTKKKQSGGGLGQYILIRFLLIFPTIFILVTMVFFLMRITGDPITAAMGGRLPPEQLQQRIHDAGYDRPLPVQYFEYLGQLGHRQFRHHPLRQPPGHGDAATYGAATLELTVNALIVALLVGIPFGMIAAHRRDHAPDAYCASSPSSATPLPCFSPGCC